MLQLDGVMQTSCPKDYKQCSRYTCVPKKDLCPISSIQLYPRPVVEVEEEEEEDELAWLEEDDINNTREPIELHYRHDEDIVDVMGEGYEHDA